MRENGDEEADIDRLPVDLLAHIFSLFTSFKDLAQASGVRRKWRQGVKESLARRESLSFSGWKMDDESTTRLVHLAYSLKELDISRSRWGCQITDHGLKQLSTAKCIGNLSSISMWGSTGITDKGVVQLTLLKSFHKGPPKVRTQISLAVAALAVHVPAEDWGDGGILNWIGDEMNSHPECIPSFLELLKVLPECPIQPNSKQCGFYVMRFMKEIIEGLSKSGSNSIKSMFKKDKYSEDVEIDEVRKEWANCVLEYI